MSSLQNRNAKLTTHFINVFFFQIAVLRRIAHNLSRSAIIELSGLYPAISYEIMCHYHDDFYWTHLSLNAFQLLVGTDITYRPHIVDAGGDYRVINDVTLHYTAHLCKIVNAVEFEHVDEGVSGDVACQNIIGLTLAELRSLIHKYYVILCNTYHVNDRIRKMYPQCPSNIHHVLTKIDALIAKK